MSRTNLPQTWGGKKCPRRPGSGSMSLLGKTAGRWACLGFPQPRDVPATPLSRAVSVLSGRSEWGLKRCRGALPPCQHDRPASHLDFWIVPVPACQRGRVTCWGSPCSKTRARCHVECRVFTAAKSASEGCAEHRDKRTPHLLFLGSRPHAPAHKSVTLQ